MNKYNPPDKLYEKFMERLAKIRREKGTVSDADYRKLRNEVFAKYDKKFNRDNVPDGEARCVKCGEIYNPCDDDDSGLCPNCYYTTFWVTDGSGDNP